MITPQTNSPLSEVIDPAVAMKTQISNAMDTTRFWTNQNGISLHFVEIQPIFHLGYGILVRKSKQRWQLYSNKTGISSDICTCMYMSIICGYKFYVLDLSLDNSSSFSTYNEIKRNDRTTIIGCQKLQLNSSPLISIPLCNVWAFPATSSVIRQTFLYIWYDCQSSILPHNSSRELITSCVLYLFISISMIFVVASSVYLGCVVTYFALF